MKSLDNKVRLSVLFNLFSKWGALSFAEKIGAYSINPSVCSTTACLVRKAHEKGIKVFSWTANKKTDIERMKFLGVDGIFSDFPDRL